jgi:hypothetical protein
MSSNNLQLETGNKELQNTDKTVLLSSLQEQLEVKSQLDCKPFQWYLENVFPELR